MPSFSTKSRGILAFFIRVAISCKALNRWLAENLGKTAVEGLSRRELFRLAAEYRLIDSVDQWMIFHRARNETSHTYDEKTAQEVFEIAQNFLPAAQSLKQHLQQKND